MTSAAFGTLEKGISPFLSFYEFVQRNNHSCEFRGEILTKVLTKFATKFALRNPSNAAQIVIQNE